MRLGSNDQRVRSPAVAAAAGGSSPRRGLPCAIPAWLASLVLHALAFVVLAWLLSDQRPAGLSDERAADVGIALKYREGPRDYFVDSESVSESAKEAASSTTASAAGQPGLAELSQVSPALDPRQFLPQSHLGGLGLSAAEEAGGGTSGDASRSTGAGGFGRSPGSGGSATLFGIRSEGSKFVYVFDRSGSMGGVGNNALRFAKQELLNSIRGLQPTQQFQIVFYNHVPVVFSPSGQAGRLSFATDENKARAERFIAAVQAAGGTEHEAALNTAIRLRPDVIFFLTDADEPRLSEVQMEDIRRRAAGIIIHTVEFGMGPPSSSRNFIARLAEQNGGQYVYIDITKALASSPRTAIED
ncbi:MAG: VWA domain-containing protein [Thermogutta sp.]|nr:VWA domain-containing protein [Thermogutta sp.]